MNFRSNFSFEKIIKVIVGSGTDWGKDNAPLLAAAIAYYTLFSLAPLLIIAIAIVGTVLGQAAVQNEIYVQIKGLMGKEGAQTVQNLILNASNPQRVLELLFLVLSYFFLVHPAFLLSCRRL